MLASSDWLKSLVSIGAMHSAESFNNRALIRSSPIALLVFKVFKGLRTKDSLILQKENNIIVIAIPSQKGRWEKLSGIAGYKLECITCD